MLAVRFLAKVRVIFYQRSTDIAYASATATCDFIATIALDERFFALWTIPNLRAGDRFFDSASPLGFSVLFNFLAPVLSIELEEVRT